MFDKFKRKLIFINMSLLTAVFIGIFGTIYIITAINLNNKMYHSLEGSIRNVRPGPMKPLPYGNILIELDENKNIINLMAIPEMDVSIAEEVVELITNTPKESGKITLHGTSYGYLKVDSQNIHDISPIILPNQTTKTKIALYDRSNQVSMMIGLLETFLFVCTASLVILLFISIYLTNKTIKPIREAFDKQKQFIADASHELKTPLAIIKTNLSLVTSNPEDTINSQSKWINYIANQTNRLSDLINEMLSLAKMDTTSNIVNLKTIDISKIIKSMVLSFEAILFENGIELEANILSDIFISGDEESIKKLFSILMDNALKHTISKGKISIYLIRDKSKVKLKIVNTGEGIPQKYLKKIFERFYRIDTSRNSETGGYGLGLSIAKSIVEQHNGNIYAESIVGKNVTFIVEFPQK